MTGNMHEMPFEFGIPTHVHFGVGLTRQLGSLLHAHGHKSVAICTDGAIQKAGILAQVEESLRSANVKYTIYGDVKRNPDITTVVDARRKCGGTEYDCIIGVGGGGPIDVAKALSVALTHDGDIRDYVAYTTGQRRHITDAVLPVMAVPTVAGAGAEVSPVAVIVDEEIQVKVGLFSRGLFPQSAFVDPALATSLPPQATASSGMDVFAHAFDALISRRSNPLSESLAIGAMKRVFTYLPYAVWQGDNLEARGAMASAAIMALMAIYLGQGGAVHTIGEPLGTIYDIPHGYACAIALPAMMRFVAPVCEEPLSCIGQIAKPIATTVQNGGNSSQESVERVIRLMKDVALPTPRSAVPNPDIDALATASMNHLAVDRVPMTITKEHYTALYEEIFSEE